MRVELKLFLTPRLDPLYLCPGAPLSLKVIWLRVSFLPRAVRGDVENFRAHTKIHGGYFQSDATVLRRPKVLSQGKKG